ncbi:COMM domain-containing protein 4 [Phytophthora boehmeriae]|uniref:COMM domain-containing protein 4 n=1 Tax=Phytophthora boehmeriae TaxID=109152 RepID=A0A8T1X4Y3_9STRA|nr:COMM domain-containing protein 4 [Phytophthora boehmeriae]
MKFRFCGGLEPPDWVLAEMPLLSGKEIKVRPIDLVAMCDAVGADVTAQELDEAQALFQDASEAKAAVAVLRFILTHAAKYDAERTDLVEELQQLGVEREAAEAIALSYESHRARIQTQQRAQRFQFPGVEKLEWEVENPSKVKLKLKLDQPAMECDALTVTTSSSHELNIEMSRDKFLALYEELTQAQMLLQGVNGSV